MGLFVLTLTLKKQPFDVMHTGEKFIEYREASKWIKSRLVDKKGNDKKYNVVKFINGYGKHRPQFVAEYKGFDIVDEETEPYTIRYSNGLEVHVKPGMIRIYIGKIGLKRNIKD